DFQGGGSDCKTTECPILIGACCFPDGSCSGGELESDCTKAGGDFQGGGSDCKTTECPILIGACCFDDGSCTDGQLEDDCTTAGGDFQGGGSECTSTECPVLIGACCFPDGSCTGGQLEADCTKASGDFQGAGSDCKAAECPILIGACCFDDGSCTGGQLEAECTTAGGDFQGAGSDCKAAECPLPTGACCFDDGSCSTLSGPMCDDAGGVYQGDRTSCDEVMCLGACCMADGSCMPLGRGECDGVGGVYQGLGTGCAGVTCPAPGECEDRNEIFEGVTAFTNVGFDMVDGPVPCSQLGADVWYTFRPDFTGTLVVSTCDSLFDTILAVYGPLDESCPCPEDLVTLLACNDDADCDGDGLLDLQSRVMIDVEAGACYKLQVGGFFGDQGDGFIRIGGLPTNDDCADAEMLAAGETRFSNVGATDDGPALDCDLGSDIWYTYTADFTGNLLISACGNDGFAPAIAVYATDECPVDPKAAVGGCADDPCPPNEGVMIPGVTPGQTFIVQVGGGGGGQGTGIITVTPTCDVPNDECVDAIAATNGSQDFCTLGATDSGVDPDVPVGADVWFTYTASFTGTLTVSTCGSGFDTVLAVYDGGCECPVDEGDLIAVNDDACDGQAELSIAVESGTCYLIQLGGRDGAAGNGTLTLTKSCEQPNDDWADAIAVANGATEFCTIGATDSG
ncbi:MAG: hypothetical protein ACYTJ0_20935, partial [Planctomycetota bacterium]